MFFLSISSSVAAGHTDLNEEEDVLGHSLQENTSFSRKLLASQCRIFLDIFFFTIDETKRYPVIEENSCLFINH